MSAPKTDIETQKRWHRVPLFGMALAVLIGVGNAFLWLTDEVASSDPPVEGQDLPTEPAPPEA